MSRYARKPQKAPADADVDAYTIDEFCARHRISRQYYYKLKAQGRGPAEIRIGTRVLIAKEAAQAWRLQNSTRAA